MTKRQAIYAVQHGLCFYCQDEIRLPAATLDHVVPRARGGKSSGNLVLCCRGCNEAKGDRAPTEDELARCREVYRQVRASGMVDQPKRKPRPLHQVRRESSTAIINRAVKEGWCVVE